VSKFKYLSTKRLEHIVNDPFHRDEKENGARYFESLDEIKSILQARYLKQHERDLKQREKEEAELEAETPPPLGWEQLAPPIIDAETNRAIMLDFYNPPF